MGVDRENVARGRAEVLEAANRPRCRIKESGLRKLPGVMPVDYSPVQ